MRKRGQLTLLIIIAILIVLVIIIYFIFKPDLETEFYLDEDIKFVYESINNCFEDVFLEALLVIGKSGGYFNLPEKSSPMYFPYYLYEGEKLNPSLENVENEIQEYFETFFLFCVRKEISKLNKLKEPNFEIIDKEFELNIKIRSDDKIYISLNFPFSIIKNERAYYFDEVFKMETDVRLHSIHSLAKSIVESHEKDPRSLCISCVSDLTESFNLNLDLLSFYPGEVLFYITDENSIVYDKEYVFIFVIKYPEENNYDPFKKI